MDNVSLIDTVNRYFRGIKILTQWLGSDGEVVDQHTAQARTNVCLLCPHNKTGIAIAEDAALAVKEQLELKANLSLHTVGENGLHTCDICKCVLRLKTWIEIQRISPQADDKFPDYCWIVKEWKQFQNQKS